MDYLLRRIPEFVFLGLVLWIQVRLGGWLLEIPRIGDSGPARRAVKTGQVLVCLGLVIAQAMGTYPLTKWLPYSRPTEWFQGLAWAWMICSAGIYVVGVLVRSRPEFDPGRRRLLGAARGLLCATPVAAIGFGVFVARNRFELRQVDIPVTDLPADLDGLRIVQLSDVHFGPFLDEADLARAVGMANETKAHLAVVTGDLITGRSDSLDACLAQLKHLRAEAGVLGCLGNHEVIAGCQAHAAQEGARLGITILRGEARQLRFGGAVLNVAGVDYQPINKPYLRGAERMARPGEVNVLLSHNPDVFPAAAARGYDVTLAGHTHGGQVTVELLHQYLNVARFFTPYVYGLYREGRASVYVTRGIGTVGVPARLGAPPEIALLRLCAT